jgi:MbtH protein
MSWGEAGTVFAVVRNHEEQYSIWPTYRPIPRGWQAVGMQGGKEECLAYIDEVWTDMRPLSLRQALQAQEQSADGAEGATDV